MNYENLSKDELIRILKNRDSQTEFGLVWNREKYQENQYHNHLISLEYLDTVDNPKIDSNSLFSLDTVSNPQNQHLNYLIEGDNLPVLKYLNRIYKNKIKCIYIDPPYNTGNNDFIYEDQFVNQEDNFRHSKWLEFMSLRLQEAKTLLSPDGVIFISIDDNEQAYLKVLCDKIFPQRFVGCFVWKRRSGANDPTGYFTSVDHEYVLCYANSGFSFAGELKDNSNYKNPDNDARGAWVGGDLTKAHTYLQRPNTFYPIFNPNTEIWYPANPDSVWRFSSEKNLKENQKLRSQTMEELIRQNKIIFPKDAKYVEYQSLEELKQAIQNGTAPKNLRDNLYDNESDNLSYLNFWIGKKIGFGTPMYKRHLSEVKRLEKPLSTWIRPTAEELEEGEGFHIETGMTQEGTKLLQQMLNNKAFNYPKPLSLIKNLIKQSTKDGDIILDFFAGSGTTGHAVLALNAEEQTNRRFILVSTSEATEQEPNKNICRDVTKQRLIQAINGYSYKTKTGLKSIEGLGGEFSYFRLNAEQLSQKWDNHASILIYLQLVYFNQLVGQPLGWNSQDFNKIIELEHNNLKLVYIPSLSLITDDDIQKWNNTQTHHKIICYSSIRLSGYIFNSEYIQIIDLQDLINKLIM